jgi:hypothetical protein
MEQARKVKDPERAEDLVNVKKYLRKNYCRSLAKEWVNAENQAVVKEEVND